MHAGEALWELYATIELIERRASRDTGVRTLAPKARECCDILSRHLQVPPPEQAQLDYRIEKLTEQLEGNNAPGSGGVSNADAQEALDLAEAILSDLEDLPEAADDFVGSVGEKVRSIAQWIEEHDHVTAPQKSALENMRAGVDRWMH